MFVLYLFVIVYNLKSVKKFNLERNPYKKKYSLLQIRRLFRKNVQF